MAGSHERLPQTLGGHVAELRGRLTKVALLFMLGAAVGYAFHDYFIEMLKRPLHEKLYYTSPAGGFNFVMKICLVFGLIVALPALVYNGIDFIRPAFSREIKKKTVRIVTFLSLVLALCGGLFAFLFIVPASLHFFQNFTNGVSALLSASDYLSFVINCVISFMVIFQAPLIVLFIDRIKPLTPRKLFAYERYIIVGSLAAAMVLPFTYDPMTQMFIAIPIIVLYNLSIIFVAFNHRKRQRSHRKASRGQASRPQTAARPAHATKPALQNLASAATTRPAAMTRPAKTQAPARPAHATARHMDIIPRARLSAPTYSRGSILAQAE